MNIAGIELLDEGGDSWVLKSKGLEMRPFRVVGPAGVTRIHLLEMVGETLYGKEIIGVESFCTLGQYGKEISIGVKA